MFVRNRNLSIKEVAALQKKNMEKLQSFRSEYERIWPSHNGVPLVPDRYLEDFITLDNQLIEGTAKVMENIGGYGFPIAAFGPFLELGELERAEYGVASVIYVKE